MKMKGKVRSHSPVYLQYTTITKTADSGTDLGNITQCWEIEQYQYSQLKFDQTANDEVPS